VGADEDGAKAACHSDYVEDEDAVLIQQERLVHIGR
jgi:hypothetical protein